MSVDSSMMAWIMRLQQTEALVEKRKEDLAGHQQRAAALQADLEHERGLSVSTTQAAALHLGAASNYTYTAPASVHTGRSSAGTGWPARAVRGPQTLRGPASKGHGSCEAGTDRLSTGCHQVRHAARQPTQPFLG